jgi:hypothetical protein
MPARKWLLLTLTSSFYLSPIHSLLSSLHPAETGLVLRTRKHPLSEHPTVGIDPNRTIP